MRAQDTRLALVMAALFVAITATLDLTQGVDRALRDLADAHRPALAEALAIWVNRLGSGGILATVAGLLAIAAAVRTRSWWPLAPGLAAFLLTGASLVPLKALVDRAAPHAVPLAASFGSGGDSYPSGHAVNTIVWYGVIAATLHSGQRWRWIPPTAVTLASVYLGFHWLTDMLAGLCLGIVLDVMIRTIMRLGGRNRADHDPRFMIAEKEGWVRRG